MSAQTAWALDWEVLVTEVRSRLRDRFIELIARAIAQDIMGRDLNDRESHHDQT